MGQVVDATLPCTTQSRTAGEPISGSATPEVHAWLLIEFSGRWEPDIDDTPWPPAVAAWLAERKRKHRHLRVQLIRQQEPQAELHAYLVTTGDRARIRRLPLDAHEDLAAHDVDAALENDADVGEPGPACIYLVCTHGKRDPCCALHGMALHRALSEQQLNGELWLSSHQGGHRFAPTMLYLPHGIHYGRLMPEDAAGLVDAHAARCIYQLANYRGHTRYSPPVQAAEAWLREQENELSFDGPVLIDHRLEDKERWVIRFRGRCGQLHRLTLEPRTGSIARKSSCDAEEATFPSWYYVVRHEAQMTE
jgi:hypothetical protein